ncbi:DNA recombination protein RmuC [Candidatus Saccharibacteria bacterium]|nr:DNA recombination protein RmuC [Candidatus Saccharibacteria bacterium]
MESISLSLVILNLVLTGVLLFFVYRSNSKNSTDSKSAETLEKNLDRLLTDSEKLSEKLVKNDTKIEVLSKKIDALTPKISDEFRANRKEINENLSGISKTVDSRVKELQTSNEKKLEQMRETVDEKLQASVEKRFNESFKTISGQLSQVYQGLGEMKNLATGVGDLKKVMEGVKTRGIYGEVQLGAIIEDILTPNQYLTNTITKKGSRDRVEFAVRMPGREAEVLLPVDSKFPIENYQRLLAAYDKGNKTEIDDFRKKLKKDVLDQAKKIQEKYIDPPKTTDFALMFLPTESLYAEVLRIPGLDEEVRKKYHISLSSPATLPVVLNGLLMGYRSVAIEKRSAEVWRILGGVKSQFSKFGDLLEGVEKKLHESANKIEDARKQSRRIEKEMANVESLPESEEINRLNSSSKVL